MASRRRHGDGNENWGVPARPARDRAGMRPMTPRELETAAPKPARPKRNARATATPARREIRTLH